MSAHRDMVTKLLTPTITAGAYAEKECVGVLQTIENASRIRNGIGRIVKAVLMDKASQIGTHAIEVYLFRENPSASTFTDNAAFTIHDDDLTKVEGLIRFTAADDAEFGQSSAGEIAVRHNLNEDYNTLGDDMYAICVTAPGSTPTFLSTSDLSLRLYLARDN